MQSGHGLNKYYRLCTTDELYEEMLTHISESEYIAYDTETTGLNVRSDKIIGVAVSGDVGVGYYLPIYFWDGSELKLHGSDSIEKAKKLVSLLTTKKLIMHNASFDVRMTLGNYGIDLTEALHCDTIVLKHTVDQHEPPQ